MNALQFVPLTLLGELAQLLVAHVLHPVPEVQDGVPDGFKGGLWVDQHGGQLTRLEGAAHGLAGLWETWRYASLSQRTAGPVFNSRILTLTSKILYTLFL